MATEAASTVIGSMVVVASALGLDIPMDTLMDIPMGIPTRDFTGIEASISSATLELLRLGQLIEWMPR
jgi:hypothetical protein